MTESSRFERKAAQLDQSLLGPGLTRCRSAPGKLFVTYVGSERKDEKEGENGEIIEK